MILAKHNLFAYVRTHCLFQLDKQIARAARASYWCVFIIALHPAVCCSLHAITENIPITKRFAYTQRIVKCNNNDYCVRIIVLKSWKWEKKIKYVDMGKRNENTKAENAWYCSSGWRWINHSEIGWKAKHFFRIGSKHAFSENIPFGSLSNGFCLELSVIARAFSLSLALNCFMLVRNFLAEFFPFQNMCNARGKEAKSGGGSEKELN